MHIRFFALAGAVAVLVACAQQNGSGPTCLAIYDYPLVQLLSPRPGATGIPSGVQTLVFQSGAFGTDLDGAVPIIVAAGTAPPVATTPTAVPSPLPSGVAGASPNPAPSTGTTQFAVSFDAAASATTYTVFARENIGGCETGTSEANLGTFTTL